MAVNTTIESLSTNASLNGPVGSTDLPSSLDDAIRYALAFVAQLRDGYATPAGMMAMFAGATAPAGWIKANGALVSRATYANLFTYASSQGLVSEGVWTATNSGGFSVGDGTTTFRIPDGRGMFLRGLDEARGLDTGRTVGTYQEQANAPHDHGVTDPLHTHAVNDPGHEHSGSALSSGAHNHSYSGSYNTGGGAGIGAYPVFNPVGDTTGTAGAHSHAVTVNANFTGLSLVFRATGISIQSQGTEGRPRNLAYPLFIKY